MTARQAATCVAVLIGAILAGQAAATAEMGPPVSTDKKLIMWATGALGPHNLGNHIADLQKDYPTLDGLILVFWPDDIKFRHWGGRNGLFCPRKYSMDDFKGMIQDLKAVDFGHINENFLLVKTTVTARSDDAATAEETVNIDWFDDRWPVIADNMGLFASLAKDGGFKGILLDFEEYHTKHNPLCQTFRYQAFADFRKKQGLPAKTFNEYAAQVRKCGRLMMEKVTRAYPEITMLMIPDTGWPEHRHYDLLPAFVDGILEGAGPRVTLIDGIEQGYPLQTYAEYMQFRRKAEDVGPRLSKVPELFRKRITYGASLWVDYKTDDFGGWHTDDGKLDANFRSPERLEQALYNAFAASDKYVWLYQSHPDFFLRPSSRREGAQLFHPYQCQLCPHRVMPEEYLVAFVDCRKPHDLAWTSPVSLEGKRYTEEELAAMGPNLLSNGSFETWRKGPALVPNDWAMGLVSGLRRVKKHVKNGKYAIALWMPKEARSYINQSFDAKPYRGKTILMGAWYKIGPNADCNVGITTKVGKRYVQSHSKRARKDGQWHFMSTRQTIPEEADRMYLQLNAYSLEPLAPAQLDGAIAVVEPAQ